MPQFDEVDLKIVGLIFDTPSTCYRICKHLYPKSPDKESFIRYRIKRLLNSGLIERVGKSYTVPHDSIVSGNATLDIAGQTFDLGSILFIEHPDMYYGLKLNNGETPEDSENQK